MKNLLLVAFVWLSLSSCTKEIKTLPTPSETGSNTFGAKINGTNWGPLKFGIAQTAPILEARFADNNSIYINARNFSSSPTETEMEIYLKNILKPGTITLNNNTSVYPYESASYAYYVKRKLTPIDEWITNDQFTGWVTVTKIDREARIISGTFEFQAVSMHGGSPINVTEGRFDVRIQ